MEFVLYELLEDFFSYYPSVILRKKSGRFHLNPSCFRVVKRESAPEVGINVLSRLVWGRGSPRRATLNWGNAKHAGISRAWGQIYRGTTYVYFLTPICTISVALMRGSKECCRYCICLHIIPGEIVFKDNLKDLKFDSKSVDLKIQSSWRNFFHTWSCSEWYLFSSWSRIIISKWLQIYFRNNTFTKPFSMH